MVVVVVVAAAAVAAAAVAAAAVAGAVAVGTVEKSFYCRCRGCCHCRRHHRGYGAPHRRGGHHCPCRRRSGNNTDG